MKRSMLLSLLLVGLWAVLGACSSPVANTLVPPTLQPPTVGAPTIASPTSTSVPATATPMGKVKVYYEDNAQVELIGPDGTRVLIDVAEPSMLSSPATANDVLLTTHAHPDHGHYGFRNSFPGQQLYVKVGSIQRPGLAIQGIASRHKAEDTPLAENGTDYIFVIDLGGLRFAHLGDIGQETLTADQLAALGDVDVAITQFSNAFSAMDATNKKGFNIVDQFKPRLIIPTHNDSAVAKLATGKWPALYTDNKFVSISKSELTGATRVLFMATAARIYGRFVNAIPVDW